MKQKRLEHEGHQLILHTNGVICSTARELASSEAFEGVVANYVAELREHNSP